MLVETFHRQFARLLIYFAFTSLFTTLAIAADPPEISVAPNSFDERLVQAVSPQVDLSLSISNIGGSNLEWSIIAIMPLDYFKMTYVLPPLEIVEPDSDSSQLLRPSDDYWSQTEPLSAELLDLTGIRILYYPHSIESNFSYLYSDLQARGATLVYMELGLNHYAAENYDLLWLGNPSRYFTINEFTALQHWLAVGNSLLLEASTVGIFNSLMSALNAGIEVSGESGSIGFTENIFSHETTSNVDSIYISASNRLQIVEPPADSLVNDVLNQPNVAYSYVGAGRIVAMADDMMSNNHIGFANNRLFGNQVVDWLAMSVNWVRFLPTAGVIPPGANGDVTLRLVGDSLAQGDYYALINISSNDPDNAEIDIPIELRIDPYICGDVNADGKVDMNDLVDSRRYYFDCGPNPEPVASIDVDCDGIVRLSDLIVLAEYLHINGILNCCD